MAARTHGRRRRRKNWKARFGFLFLGIILGIALGIFLCFRFNIVAALDTAQNDVLGSINVLLEEREITPQRTSDELSVITDSTTETVPFVTTMPAVTPTPEPEITPEPVVVTPEPVVITSAPAELTPEPVEPTAVPTEEPTAEPEPTAAPVEEIPAEKAGEEKKAQLVEPYSRTEPFAAKEWFAFDTEIDENGEPYYMEDGNCTAASLAVRVADFMDPDEYAAQYADVYQLYGSEAALVLEIRNDSDVAVKPQEAIRIAFANKADVLYDGYPLMDAPMAGSTDISIAPGETMTVYKRFAYDDLEGLYPFVTVTYMVGGETYRSYTILNTLG